MKSEGLFERHMAGFSLIELMIVVTIIAIIAAIAYPSYERSVLKSHRADAENLLTTDYQILDRCYTQYFAYNSASCTPPLATSTQYHYYTAATTTLAASTFVITATAFGNQTKDTDCNSFSIDNTGKKTAYTASAATNSTACWNQ